MDRDALQRQFHDWLREVTPETYGDRRGAVVVPRSTTRIVIDSELLEDGRFSVQLRAPILQDIAPSPDLAVYVALHCNAFRLGNLYLFKVGDKFDLDYTNKVMDSWLTRQNLVELVAVAENNAVSAARTLHERFGGRLPQADATLRENTFIGQEQWDREDVYEALNDALETQECLVVGTAERIERPGTGVLTDGWFVVNPTYLWLAGRDERRGTVLWRIPHADVRSDRVSVAGNVSDYAAELANGSTLTVTTRTTGAVVALRDARRDPTASAPTPGRGDDAGRGRHAVGAGRHSS